MRIEIRWFRFAAVMVNAVIAKCILIAGGYFLGAWLDKKWGTEPYLALVFILLAMGLGLTWIILVAKRFKF